MKYLFSSLFLLMFIGTATAQELEMDFENSETTTQKAEAEIVSYYINETLYIKGYEGSTEIAIYDLLGNKVRDLGNIDIGTNFNFKIDLPKNKIYVVRIDAETVSESFRIMSLTAD